MVGDEDCLTLDVFTPSVVFARLPVVVYLAAGLDTVDPALLPNAQTAAANGVVFVVVNVRQGALGFLSHDVISGMAGKD